MAQIDDYLAELDPGSAAIVAGAYAQARDLVPDAEDGTSYGMPALILRSRPLLSVMRAKAHIGIYPYSPAVVAEVVPGLPPIPGLTSAKGTIRVPLGAAVPEVLIRSLVLARRDEILATLAVPRPSRARRSDAPGI